MPTRNVNLTDRCHRFVEDLIVSGRFQNASEAVRAGLHLLEQQVNEERQRLALLRSLVDAGFDEIDQGLGIALEGEEELVDFIGALGRRAAERADGP